ncbi:MAG: hypothetical protein LH472_06040 [Pyrinomonadaceae bacterium]|nr:hypothetical protein [Pyrinomonadaceae bacterium]
MGDKNHIGRMVREFKSIDKRFETEAAAVRYYVHIGIVAESATEDLSNNLNHSIIQRSIKLAVEKQLVAQSNHIEILQNLIKESTAKNEDNFSDIARRTSSIETKLDNGFELIVRLLNGILSTGEQALRNIIVLRSIFYVFFLGHQTGRIAPGKENFMKWSTLINLAHDRANQLSIQEVKLLNSETLESTVIQKMASDIFMEIAHLPQPHTE